MKRSSAQNGSACKRRAPYALRACDACRRRKGKCNGRQPCDHCTGRNQECVYNGTASDDWAAPLMDNIDWALHQADNASQPTAAATLSHDHIVDLVLEVKSQVDNLSRRVGSQSQTAPFTVAPKLYRDNDNVRPLSIRAFTSEDHYRCSTKQTSVITQCFWGPTSPDYSLNIAQIRVRQSGSVSNANYHRQLQLASICNEPTIDSATSEGGIGDSPAPVPAHQRGDAIRLMHFRSLINYREALRLLGLYQEIVGDFHPFVDIDKMTARTRAWYIGSQSPGVVSSTDSLGMEDDLVAYNLVLAIALHADVASRDSNTEAVIWKNCEAAVNTRLIGQTTGIQQVIIVLLKAWYDFANDMPRSAWRTCGVAGRMLMELGFHNCEVLTRMLPLEKQRTGACNLLCSIIVLDRQWSATTGLPTNFDANSFDASLQTGIKNLYLKAMMSFILISDKFHEPISTAAIGGQYPDDAFELLDFQIEQWRTKAIGSYSLSNLYSGKADPAQTPPSWAIILHLRADSIRGLLLRPFFFSQADTATSQRYLRPAIELLTRVTSTLHTLDTTTDLYRKHHPYYQHVLASSTALSFLLAATMKQNKDTVLKNLAPDLSKDYSRSFEMSVALASQYAPVSQLSRKLLKRLADMREILEELGLLEDPITQVEQQAIPINSPKSPCSSMSKSFKDSDKDWRFCQMTEACGLDFPLIDDNNIPSPSAGANVGEPALPQGWPESFLAYWPSDDLDDMFIRN